MNRKYYILLLIGLVFSSMAQKKSGGKKARQIKEENILSASTERTKSETGVVPGARIDSSVAVNDNKKSEDEYALKLADAIENYRKSKVLQMDESNIKGSYKISVAYYKTSHIIFPSNIKYFDVGSDRVMAEVAEGLNNVLKLKASAIDAFETNVTVITSDGKFYSFIASYNENPIKLNLNMTDAEPKEPEKVTKSDKIIFADTYYTEKELTEFAKKAIKTSNIKHIAEKLGKITFKVSSLQSKESNVFINVKVINNSPLDFDMETLKFFVRDVERKKKELTQEIEVKPAFAYIQDKFGKIEKKLCAAGTEYSFCFMLPKFVITEDKNLDIDIREKNGGRNATLTIDYDTFYYEMVKL